MANDADILAAVTRVETVGGSIIALVQQLLADSGVPQATIDGITARLNTISDQMEAAVLAGTPQQP